MTEKEFQMKKEWKLDAYLCVKALNNPVIHFNLGNLYMFLRRDERLTEEEIQTFNKLLNKIASSNLEFDLAKEVFEDDQLFKDREKEYEKDHEIRLIYNKVKKEWEDNTLYPSNQIDHYIYDLIEKRYNTDLDAKVEEIFNGVMKKCKKDDELNGYVISAEMRDERKTICPGE